MPAVAAGLGAVVSWPPDPRRGTDSVLSRAKRAELRAAVAHAKAYAQVVDAHVIEPEWLISHYYGVDRLPPGWNLNLEVP